MYEILVLINIKKISKFVSDWIIGKNIKENSNDKN